MRRDWGDSRVAGGWEIAIAECEASDSEDTFSLEKVEHRQFLLRSADFLKRGVALRQSTSAS